MRAVLGLVACSFTASLVAACTATVPVDDGNVVFESEDQLAQRADGQRPAFIRIRTIDMERQNQWTLVNPAMPDKVEYDANDVLSMIGDLQPNALERYTSGDVTQFSFHGSGFVPGSTMIPSEFMKASELATNCPAFITARVSLSDYDESNPEAFYQMEKDLLNLSVGPHAMRQISLDIWASFADGTLQRSDGTFVNTHPAWDETFLTGIFDRLHHDGWNHVGINLCGTKETEPLEHLDAWHHADFVDVCVGKDRMWGPDDKIGFAPTQHLDTLNDPHTSVKRRIMYIDFPQPMEDFQSLTADQQAHVLTELAENQSVLHYTLLYPIVQLEPTSDQLPQSQPGEPGGTRWDATKIHTTANSNWNGQSLYDVMRALIRAHNTPDQTCP